MLSSGSYAALGISSDALDAQLAQYTGPDKKAVLIPFKGENLNIGVVGLFNDQGQLRTVCYFEAVTNLPADKIYDELKSGNYSGGFIFQIESVRVEIEMDHSKIISSKGANSKSSGRTLACRDWDSYGGVLWCAGSRLENMNWLDAGLCYSQFVPCMAILVASCAVDGCAVQ